LFVKSILKIFLSFLSVIFLSKKTLLYFYIINKNAIEIILN
jgi:hypothetical protein